MGQWREALSTAHEAVELYRELAGLNRDAFLADLARSIKTRGTILMALDRNAEAAGVFAEGVRLALQETERYPEALLPLALGLLRDYVSSCEAANVEPDSQLFQEAIRILSPYLEQQQQGGES